MKKHTITKRLSALALILVMTLAPAVPAGAADNNAGYQVKIYPNSYTSIPASTSDALARRFEAYQIFQGDIDDDEYNENVGEDTHEPPVISGLTVSGWGVNIPETKYGALLYALSEIDRPAGKANIKVEQLLNLLEHAETDVEKLYNINRYKLALPNFANPENWIGEIVGGTWNAGGEYASAKDAITADYGTLTVGALFGAALDFAGYECNDNEYKVREGNTEIIMSDSAAVIAAVLNDFTDASGNTALAEVFAKVVGAKNGTLYTYLNSSPCAVSAWHSDGGCWTIDLQGGYYLFIDTAGSGADKALSDYIMAVFGSQSITVKSYAPTVEKVIVDGDNGNAHGDDFQIGDAITFRITGTMPENIDNYETYTYNFTDTMTDGLSYMKGSMKVYAEAPTGSGSRIYLLAKEGSDSSSGNPGFTVPDGAGGIIGVNLDLKTSITGRPAAAIGRDPSGTATQPLSITSGWKIVIQYQAALNNSATLDANSATLNNNKVILTYSDSVININSAANTTESSDYIYDFGIDIQKYYRGIDENGAGDTATPAAIPLQGAGFTLTRKNTVNYKDMTYYAFSGDGTVDGAITWLTLDDIGTYTGRVTRLSDLTVSYQIGGKASAYNGPLSAFSLTGLWPVYVNGSVVSETRRTPVYGSETQYAVFEESGGTYYLYGWIRESDLKKYLGVNGAIKWDDEGKPVLKAIKDGNGKLSESIPDYGGRYIYIVTGDGTGGNVDGYEGNLRIKGLKDEIYTLSEVIVPEGFRKRENMTVEFVAEYYSTVLAETGHTSSTLKNLYYTVDDNSNYVYIFKEGEYQTFDNKSFSKLIAKLEVPNDPTMPRSGGMGTTLFYISGSALLIGAALILIFSNVKKKRGSKEKPV